MFKLRFSLRRKVILTIVAAATLLLAGAVILLVRQVSEPANGTVLKTVPIKSTAVTGDKVLASKYFTTHYPARYSEVPTGPSASLQSWMLFAHQGSIEQESGKISVIITALPQGGVKEDSAYKLYSAYPALYTLSGAKYGHDEVIVAKRSDSGYQQTVLWPHGNYLLTVSLTAGTETSVVDSDLQTVLTHVVWLL